MKLITFRCFILFFAIYSCNENSIVKNESLTDTTNAIEPRDKSYPINSFLGLTDASTLDDVRYYLKNNNIQFLEDDEYEFSDAVQLKATWPGITKEPKYDFPTGRFLLADKIKMGELSFTNVLFASFNNKLVFLSFGYKSHNDVYNGTNGESIDMLLNFYKRKYGEGWVTQSNGKETTSQQIWYNNNKDSVGASFHYFTEIKSGGQLKEKSFVFRFKRNLQALEESGKQLESDKNRKIRDEKEKKAREVLENI